MVVSSMTNRHNLRLLSKSNRRSARRRGGKALPIALFALSSMFNAHAAPSASSVRGSKTVNSVSLNNGQLAGRGTKIRLRGGQMQTQLQDGKMVLTGFNGKFGGGDVRMAGHLANGGSATTGQSLDVTLQGVDVKQLAALVAPTNAPSWLDGMKITGSAKATWTGQTPLQAGKSLNGNFELTIGAGTITDRALLEQLAKATGISDLSELAFQSGKITGTAVAGAITLQNLEIIGTDFRLNATGEVDLKQEDVDVAFDVHVTQALAEKSSFYKMKNVLSFFKGNSKATVEIASTDLVQVPRFSLVGPMRKPEVRLAATQAPAKPDALQPVSSVAASEKVSVVADASQTETSSKLTKAFRVASALTRKQ